MAIIVESKIELKKYILLGTGYGQYKTVSPSFFGGSLLPDEEDGATMMVSVCDETGKIEFITAEDIRVVSVDGIEIETYKELLVCSDRKTSGVYEDRHNG